ncbi:MAG: molybdopterin-guanine dinucleotide biosynthesis protein B [Defluviitaleaceae bacterium]|nr:molybdopterin-guanine dinucleotide biosynthesis protein B [Defluviitaleaceae bacterium]
MKAFAVCGITNSGKTVTTERIIGELIQRGYRVGSIKHIHCDDYKIDPDPTKDTARHLTAGSRMVCAHAKQETALLFPHRLPTEKLLSLYQGECDWVVCEGVSDIAIPKIVTAHNKDDLQEKWSDQVFCVSGVISSSISEYGGIPAINAHKDIKGLVDLVEGKVVDWSKLMI